MTADGLEPMNRLRRLDFVFELYPVYFLTLCTDNRKRILDNPVIHDAFQEFGKEAATHGIWPGRYTLMPDHLHMLVAFAPGSLCLSKWIKSLRNSMSKTLRTQQISAPHWQKGFFDHLIRSEESYSEKYQYILYNPVTAGLVERPEDWPYKGEIFPLMVWKEF